MHRHGGSRARNNIYSYRCDCSVYGKVYKGFSPQIPFLTSQTVPVTEKERGLGISKTITWLMNPTAFFFYSCRRTISTLTHSRVFNKGIWLSTTFLCPEHSVFSWSSHSSREFCISQALHCGKYCETSSRTEKTITGGFSSFIQHHFLSVMLAQG